MEMDKQKESAMEKQGVGQHQSEDIVGNKKDQEATENEPAADVVGVVGSPRKPKLSKSLKDRDC